jgi:ATP-dependent Clp protease ATP-binding subunit ClpC
VLALAQDEARNRQHPFMDTEHLLLGLIGIEDGVAARALVDLGVDMDRLRRNAEEMLANIDRSTMHDMGMTPRAKKVIDLAVQEAKRLKHRYIGTEHLLLGLVREEEGPAAKALVSFGVTLDAARAQVVQLLGSVARDATSAGQGATSSPVAWRTATWMPSTR